MKMNAFFAGADSNFYASNATICFNYLMNVIEYDFDLLMIKLMYGTVKEGTLNTTLFLGNVSYVNYVCIDAAENFYVYAMYKYDLFGRDNTNVLLGSLQNLLGSILTINKVYQQVIDYDKLGETENMFFAFGRIWRMITDIEPVMIESGSLNETDDDQIYFTAQNDSAQTGVWGAKPKVKQTTEGEANQTADANETLDTYDLDANMQGFDLADFDWTFGLLDAIPGISFLFKLEGPFEFVTGFLNGTQILKS